MRIEDYPRPKDDNRRGVHWSASVYHPTGAALDFWIDELTAMKIKWVKVLDDGGGSSLELCQRLLRADMMPIVRLYRFEPNPGTIAGREDTVRRLVAAGVRYFETNNEPDLVAEWKGGSRPGNWLEVVIDNFISDADRVLGLGGLPALPAMGVGSTVDPIAAVVNKGRADLFERGAWVAIHNYTLNHPLDYPYDPVNQEGQAISQEEYDRLAPWAWDGQSREQINAWRKSDKNPGDTLKEDAACFLSVILMDEMIQKALGHRVPIISTEGGPVAGWKEDRRYPRVDPFAQADRTVMITEFMQGTREIAGISCPESYFAMCHWLIANYRLGFYVPTWESQSWYTDWWNRDFNLKGEMPVVAALKALPTVSIHDALVAVIAGQLLRADLDEPLPDLEVALMAEGVEVARVRTGSDGAFRFERLLPGAYDLSIAPWGIVARAVVAAVEETPQPLVVRLAEGGNSQLTGAVSTPEGVATGERVLLQRDGVDVGVTVTDAAGRFCFSHLPFGVYRLMAANATLAGIVLDGWESKDASLSVGRGGEPRYVVALTRLLPPEEAGKRNLLYGVVSAADGSGLNGIKVEMSWQGAAAGTVFPVRTSGSDASKPPGSFEFLHSPGAFRLRVVQGDWPSDETEYLDTTKPPGREAEGRTYEVNFRLERQAGPAGITGVMPGAQPGLALKLIGDNQAARETLLGEDGSFAFEDLTGGRYALAAAGLGTLVDDIVLVAGGQFHLTLAMNSRIVGRALGHSDGMVAVLYAPMGWTRQTPLDRAGGFAFDHLPAGIYRLELGAHVRTDLLLTGENRLQLAPIDLAQGRRSIVRGRVANGAGEPQAEVLMILRLGGVVITQMFTTADGAYSFANLPAGEYSLEAVGLGEVAGGIHLDGEGEAVVDVLWPSEAAQAVLQGRVTTADDLPAPDVTVRLLRDGAEVAAAQTDRAGGFRFTGLAAGRYTLSAGGDAPPVTVALAEGAIVSQDIVLPARSDRLMAHYLLLATSQGEGTAGQAGARLALGLALPRLARAGVTAGYSLADATHAARVTIVGDQVSAEAEAALRAAGCEVTRLSGNGYELAAALDRLLSEE